MLKIAHCLFISNSSTYLQKYSTRKKHKNVKTGNQTKISAISKIFVLQAIEKPVWVVRSPYESVRPRSVISHIT